LVATRQLYDTGVLVQQSASLAGLPVDTVLRVSPYDFDRLGVQAGDEVRLNTNRATVSIACHPDAALPRGAAWLRYAQPNLPVATLLEADAAVTDVRVETL
jgi:hypothetical protein